MNLDDLYNDDLPDSAPAVVHSDKAVNAVVAKPVGPALSVSGPPQTWRQVAMAAIGQFDQSRQAELRRLYDTTARDYLGLGDPDYADQIALAYLNERLRDGLGRQITIPEFTVDGAGAIRIARWQLDAVHAADKASPPLLRTTPHKVLQQSAGLLPGMRRAI